MHRCGLPSSETHSSQLNSLQFSLSHLQTQCNSLAQHACKQQILILVFFTFSTMVVPLGGGQWLIRLMRMRNSLKGYNNTRDKNVFCWFYFICACDKYMFLGRWNKTHTSYFFLYLKVARMKIFAVYQHWLTWLIVCESINRIIVWL